MSSACNFAVQGHAADSGTNGRAVDEEHLGGSIPEPAYVGFADDL
jgi:hypothetical protein